MSTATPLTENNHHVRERIYEPSELERVMQMIHESRATGTLMLDISQGGLRNIRFHEVLK